MTMTRICNGISTVMHNTAHGAVIGTMVSGSIVTIMTATGAITHKVIISRYPEHQETQKVLEGFYIGGAMLAVVSFISGAGVGFIQGLQKVFDDEEPEEVRVAFHYPDPLRIIYELPETHVHPAALAIQSQSTVEKKRSITESKVQRTETKALPTECKTPKLETKVHGTASLASINQEDIHPVALQENASREQLSNYVKETYLTSSLFFNPVRRYENLRGLQEVAITDFCCPISGQIMNNPVYIKDHEKQKYERQELERWFQEEKKRTMPLTNAVIQGETVTLIPDFSLQAKIQQYLAGLEEQAEARAKFPKAAFTHRRTLSR